MPENDTSSDDIERTDEPILVEWFGGMGDRQSVRVNPYTGKITVNGREFDIGELCSDDIPDWLFNTGEAQPNGGDS